jgi:hypothetical protein
VQEVRTQKLHGRGLFIHLSGETPGFAKQASEAKAMTDTDSDTTSKSRPTASTTKQHSGSILHVMREPYYTI